MKITDVIDASRQTFYFYHAAAGRVCERRNGAPRKIWKRRPQTDYDPGHRQKRAL